MVETTIVGSGSPVVEIKPVDVPNDRPKERMYEHENIEYKTFFSLTRKYFLLNLI